MSETTSPAPELLSDEDCARLRRSTELHRIGLDLSTSFRIAALGPGRHRISEHVHIEIDDA